MYLHVTHNDNTHKNCNVHKIDHVYNGHDRAHLPTTVVTDYSDLIKTLQAAKRANNIA